MVGSDWSGHSIEKKKRSKVTVYKCHTGPATLLRDNITELQEHQTIYKWKIIEGDFYKCEEVAFSECISSSGGKAMLSAEATSACQI